jgi:uncharacterized protein YbcI
MAFASDIVQTDQHPSTGTKLAALSDGLVKLHKDVCGRGPTHARSFAAGDAVVCLLHGGLTRAEKTLLENDNADAVAEQRRSLYTVMKPQAIRLAEEVLGHRVTAMTLAADPVNELETAVFLLDAPLDS